MAAKLSLKNGILFLMFATLLVLFFTVPIIAETESKSRKDTIQLFQVFEGRLHSQLQANKSKGNNPIESNILNYLQVKNLSTLRSFYLHKILLVPYGRTSVFRLEVADIFERHTKTEGLVVIGTLSGEENGSFNIVISPNSVSGYITSQTGAYRLSDLGSGIVEIQSLNSFELSGTQIYGDDVIVPKTTYLESVEEEGYIAENSGSTPDDGSQIDVLVAFTSRARQDAGGLQQMLAKIDSAVTESNISMSNTSVHTRMRLVGYGEVNFSESGNMPLDLDRIRIINDGYGDEIGTWRDSMKADAVILIGSNNYSFCGIAYLGNGMAYMNEYAYAMVAVGCLDSGILSFTHEFGHILGAHHDTNNVGSDASYLPFGYGYQSTTGQFRTIMAYDCPGSCPRINYWSNNKFTYNGLPMGNTNSDNRRLINYSAYVVANYRNSSTGASVNIFDREVPTLTPQNGSVDRFNYFSWKMTDVNTPLQPSVYNLLVYSESNNYYRLQQYNASDICTAYACNVSVESFGLQPNITYKWYAHISRTKDGYTTEWQPYIYENTIIFSPLAAPNIIAPENTTINTITPTFRWSFIKNANNFHIWVGTPELQEVANVIFPYNSDIVCTYSGYCESSIDIQLDPTEEYVWYIRAKDNLGWSEWSNHGSFKTPSMNCPRDFSPVCGENGVTYPNACNADKANIIITCNQSCPCNL